MGVESRLSKNDTVLTLMVSGDFDFSLINEFSNAYQSKEAVAAENLIVDLSKALTIDSSALGMLLNMQKHLGRADGDIKIVNCNDVVMNVFEITNFQKKFSIEK